jgi:hypothetical protein
MYIMSTFGLFMLYRVDFEIVGDVNPSDDQHIAVLFDLTSGFTNEQAFTCGYPARLQRAA